MIGDRLSGSRLLLPALALCAALPALAAAPQEKSVSVESSVAAGDWTGARLRNLPAGASLRIQITTEGEFAVLLLDGAGYQRFPEVDSSLFRGRVHERIEFTASIPEAGDYYLIIDNRDGDTQRDFTLTARAARGDNGGSGERGARPLDEQLARIAALLERVFVFDALDMRAVRCADGGSGGSGAPDDAVVVCVEYARKLLATLEDEERAEHALLFATLHQAASVLLRQWGYPFYDDEDVADELAAVLMILFQQTDVLRSHAQYIASLAPGSAAARELAKESPPALSAARARSLLDLLQDAERLARWQALLIPHMQTGFLRKMQERSAPARTQALIDEELARREP